MSAYIEIYSFKMWWESKLWVTVKAYYILFQRDFYLKCY